MRDFLDCACIVIVKHVIRKTLMLLHGVTNFYGPVRHSFNRPFFFFNAPIGHPAIRNVKTLDFGVWTGLSFSEISFSGDDAHLVLSFFDFAERVMVLR